VGEGVGEAEVEGGHTIRARYLQDGNCWTGFSLRVQNSFSRPNMVDPNPRQNPVGGMH
jgi:hypothetical protein